MKDLIPKSIPIILLLFLIGFGSSTLLSTNMDAKYLLVGVLLIVTILIFPLNFLCKMILIPFLNLGKNINSFIGSISTCCGHWKDCLFDFFLNLGNDVHPLKKFWNALSRLRKDICKDWLLTSFNQIHSFFKSINWLAKSIHVSCTLLPAYAICLVSNPRLYINLTQPKCLLSNSICDESGYNLYLKVFSMTQRYNIFTNITNAFIKNIFNSFSSQGAEYF